MERMGLLIALACVCLLCLTAGVIYAQRSTLWRSSAGLSQSADAAVPWRAPLNPGFTYQGWLRDSGGNPVTAICDFTFALWNDPSSGSQVGSDSVVTGVAVTEGYFAAMVNAGGSFGPTAFVGEARWLEIAVQCTGDPSPVILSPRQPLSAAPFAHYSRSTPWSGISGTPNLQLRVTGTCTTGNAIRIVHADGTVTCEAVGVGTHDHWGEAWSGSGTGLTLSGGSVGLAGRGDSVGLRGTSEVSTGRGVFGYNSATTGPAYGVYGRTDASGGTGVYGYAYSTSGTTYGVFGIADSSEGRGVVGFAGAGTGTTFGVYGESGSIYGCGMHGYASATTGGTCGVWAVADAPEGIGVAAQGGAYGAYAFTDSTAGVAVYGRSDATSGSTAGVYGVVDSTSGRGVRGSANATTGITVGVYGWVNSSEGRAVYAIADAQTGTSYGVYSRNDSASGYAGYFSGDVDINGTLSKSGGSFKIDHPLDPANKYLYHSFVESPDMKNVYDGVLTLDDEGTAWVELPDWFEVLNKDFRYQLTCIGGYAPVYVSREIADNRFHIAGGTPGLKVSWQVTGIRQDPWAEAHRIPVEADKPTDERGTYLFPELYGHPEEMGLDYQRNLSLRDDEPEAPAPDGAPWLTGR